MVLGFEIFLDGQRRNNWRGDSFEMADKLEDANAVLAAKLHESFKWSFRPNFQKAFFFSPRTQATSFKAESGSVSDDSLSDTAQWEMDWYFPSFASSLLSCRWLASHRGKAGSGRSSGNAQTGSQPPSGGWLGHEGLLLADPISWLLCHVMTDFTHTRTV